MTSLGKAAYTQNFECDKIICKDNIETGNSNMKITSIGDDSLNKITMNQVGDEFFLKYSQVFTVDRVSTTDASADVTLRCSEASTGLTTGEYVNLVPVSTAPATINNIPSNEFNGEHQVTVVTATTFTISLTTAANSTGNVTGVGLPVTQFRVDRYKSLNMGDTGVTWVHGTQAPTATRENTALFVG